MNSTIDADGTKGIISSFGPFEIIDMMNSIGPEKTDALIREAIQEKNKSALAHLAYFQRYFERFLPDVARAVENAVIANHH